MTKLLSLPFASALRFQPPPTTATTVPHAKHLATKQSRVRAVTSLLTGTRTPHARLSTKLALIATICTISVWCASKSVTANLLRLSPAKQKILLQRYEFQSFSTVAPRICTSLLWWTRGLQFQQSTTQWCKSLVHTCSVATDDYKQL